MLYPRYFGRFFGLMPFAKPENEHDELPERLWEVTIYQTADAPFEPRALMFDADTPLLFEWGETSPENVIEGSTATLKLISPDDIHITQANERNFSSAIGPPESPQASLDGMVVHFKETYTNRKNAN